MPRSFVDHASGVEHHDPVRLRERRRLSREQLGARIGKTAGAIEQYERASNYPSTPTLGALAHALDVSVAELFDDGDPNDPRARYIRAVTDLMPPMSDEEIAAFAAVIRARRTVSAGDPKPVSA